MKKLWVDSYKPKAISDYVFSDESQRNIINKWITEKDLPHVALFGHAGVGKTALANLLVSELGIHDYDYLSINASRFTSIDDIRNKVVGFIQILPFASPFKVVLLDECDFLSINSQAALRGLIEDYSSTARFIFTANYQHKVIPAIISRTQSFRIEAPDKVEFTTRVATILLNENVEFDLDTLDSFIEGTYPDLRKCINSLQQNCVAGKLVSPVTKDADSGEWRIQMVELFKQGKIQEARALLCASASADEIEEIFTWIYNNLSVFSDDVTKQDSIVLIIKDAIVSHPVFADPEINLSACLIRIMRVLNK
jgi:DNA polymerase III delta prime subunit